MDNDGILNTADNCVKVPNIEQKNADNDKLGNAFEGALPQAGLNSADIVIEQIINDQVTRLAAVRVS